MESVQQKGVLNFFSRREGNCCLFQAVTDGDLSLDYYETGPLDSSNDENDIDEETM